MQDDLEQALLRSTVELSVVLSVPTVERLGQAAKVSGASGGDRHVGSPEQAQPVSTALALVTHLGGRGDLGTLPFAVLQAGLHWKGGRALGNMTPTHSSGRGHG